MEQVGTDAVTRSCRALSLLALMVFIDCPEELQSERAGLRVRRPSGAPLKAIADEEHNFDHSNDFCIDGD